MLKVFDTTEQHLGYDFPINPLRILPYSVSNKFHDFHHTHNVGNFGGWSYYLDSFLWTDKAFKMYTEKKQKEKLEKFANNLINATSQSIPSPHSVPTVQPMQLPIPKII